MKHAGADALDRLEPLLKQLRTLPLKEKSRGIFYLKSSAFLHFHEDAAGLFADLRQADQWQRYKVDTPKEQRDLFTTASKSIRT